jgi:hypothetical protein
VAWAAVVSSRHVGRRYSARVYLVRWFGLIAEEVEKVNPDLVVRNKDGKPYTVRYEAVNAMLLNEFLKEHRTVEKLKKEIAALTAIVKEQAAQIQKVNAQLEVRKPAKQTVLNARARARDKGGLLASFVDASAIPTRAVLCLTGLWFFVAPTPQALGA